jgi:DNA (cytosine-5)-methyltransferase 1
MKPTLGSLFAGIGGIDLGFERAGFETKWQVEINPYCRKVLARHFPNAERFEDVRNVGSSNLRRVDVIAGGFPCQDISNAGNRAGIEGDTRSGLWREFSRIISELRPSFALVENVAALLVPIRDDRGRLTEPAPIGRVLGDLADCGYDAEWQVISAADMGALHLRERVWIVAYPHSDRQHEPQSFPSSPYNQEWNHSPYRENGATVASEIRPGSQGHLPNSQAERFQEEGELRHIESSERIPSGCEARIFTDPREERTQRFLQETLPRLQGLSWCKDVRRVEDLRGRSDIPEPLFRGSRDGVPDWVDRVGACGNSVIPAIPELIANRIREQFYEQRKTA